jgi:hypothetical protein
VPSIGTMPSDLCLVERRADDFCPVLVNCNSGSLDFRAPSDHLKRLGMATHTYTGHRHCGFLHSRREKLTHRLNSSNGPIRPIRKEPDIS